MEPVECQTCRGDDCGDCIYMYRTLNPAEKQRYDARIRQEDFSMGHPMSEND